MTSSRPVNDVPVVPWVRTDRLELWRPGVQDVDAVFAVHSDPETYRHLPSGRMRDTAEAEQLVDAWNAHWAQHGFGYAVVRERDDERVLGFVGAKHQRILDRDVLNVYYRFAPAAWGRGFATEALEGVIRHLGVDRRAFAVRGADRDEQSGVRIGRRSARVRAGGSRGSP